MVFKITQSQLTARLTQPDAFAAWFVDDLMEEELPLHKDEQPRDMLIEMVMNGIGVAEKIGIHKRESQTQFIALMFDLGPFFMHDGIREIFLSSELSEEAKLDRFYALDQEPPTREDESVVVNAMLAADSTRWFDQELALREGGIGPMDILGSDLDQRN